MKVRARHPLALAMTVALLLLSVAFALGACGSGSTTAGSTTYVDPDYGFSFDYPAGWNLEKFDAAQSNALRDIAVGDPDGASAGGRGVDGVVISLRRLNQAVDESLLPDVKPELERLFTDMQSQNETWQTLEPLTQTTVAGLPGYVTTASFDFDANTPAMTTYYLLFDGQIQYFLVVQAAAENWEKDQGVFDALIASFKPGTSAE
jgi:hypothetical protein